MPAAKDPSTDLIYMPIPILARPKGDGNDVILSPEEKSRRIAAKKAQIEARRAFELSMLRRPILPVASSKELKNLEASDSLKKFFATGEVDLTLKEGFEEMGRNYNDWAGLKNKFKLTDAQTNLLLNAHHTYFGIIGGIPVDNVISSPSKKPNVLLLVGVAVVGLLVIRKVLN
jgi:hypothetical protein